MSYHWLATEGVRKTHLPGQGDRECLLHCFELSYLQEARFCLGRSRAEAAPSRSHRHCIWSGNASHLHVIHSISCTHEDFIRLRVYLMGIESLESPLSGQRIPF